MPHQLMKTILLLLCFNIGVQSNLLAVQSSCTATEQIVSSADKRVAKKIKRLQKRAEKMSAKPAKSDLFQNGKFRFGLFALIGGVLLSAVSLIVKVPAIIGYLGVIGVIAGMVLIFWGLLEHFS